MAEKDKTLPQRAAEAKAALKERGQKVAEWVQDHKLHLDQDDRDFIISVLPLAGLIAVIAAGGLAYETFVAPHVEAAQLAKATQEAAQEAASRIIFQCTQHGPTALKMLTLEGSTSSVLDDIQVVTQTANIDMLSQVSAVVRGTIFQHSSDMAEFARRVIAPGHGEIFSGIKDVCTAVQTNGPAVLPAVAP